MSPKIFKEKNGYEINGLWYPRVTSICSIIAKPGLERWIANQPNFAFMERRRKKITDWGTLVHNAIEDILLDKSTKVNPKIRPLTEAFFGWLDENKIKVIDIEKRVFSEQNAYAGTFDVLAELNGKLGILDLKTSRDIWDDHFIQTAAYFNAYNEKGRPKAKTHWILKINQYRKCEICGAKRMDRSGDITIRGGKRFCRHVFGKVKGECELKKVDNHKSFIDTFLSAKKLWEFSNRGKLSRIENYPKISKTNLTICNI